MGTSRKQWYWLTEEQLGRLVGQGTYPDAPASWDRCRDIIARGGRPAVFYSAFNGFRVLDKDDPEQFKLSLGLSQRAKPFRM